MDAESEAMTADTELLARAFGFWQRRARASLNRKQRIQAACRVGARLVLRRCWHRWLQLRHDRLVRKERVEAALVALERRRNERALSRVWSVWQDRARLAARKEQNRRLAARFAYTSTLKKALAGFQSCVVARRRLRLVEAVRTWQQFTASQLSMHRADAHARKQLARRVFRSGFRQFLLTRRLQHGMLLHAQKLHARRLLTATLAQWRSASVSETQHDHSLLRQLQAAKARRLTVRVMAEWSEYARAKMASRLVTAELRGRAQTRMLRLSVHGWLDAVAALRWKQVHQERADFHRRRVLLRQCLVRWRSEVQVRREYRRKVRTALIHWKLTRERRAFDIWSRYCASKRAKRQRIHDALAFRHASFVRDGLQRWISAAMHLQAQRDDRMQDHQAARTARVWRRVAVIARHWRYLAGRRRIGNISQQMRALPSDDEDVNWLTLKRHRPRLKATPIHSTVELEGVPRVEEAATLSGFVRLPRTRPQPRKPIELLLWEQQQQHRPKKIDPIDKWPTSLVHDEDLGRLSSDTMERAEPSAFNVGIPATEVPAAPVKRVGGKSDIYSNTDSIQRSKQSADSVLDILESRLRKLEARKREWVALERQLSTLRANVTISNGSEQHMLDQVRGLEREVDARRQQWQLAQKRVRHVATELAQLQAALHVQ